MTTPSSWTVEWFGTTTFRARRPGLDLYSGGGTLQIDSCTLQDNPSGEFQNAPGIFDSVNGQEAQPVVEGSSIG